MGNTASLWHYDVAAQSRAPIAKTAIWHFAFAAAFPTAVTGMARIVIRFHPLA
jgi:hypothetical protein